MKNSLLLTPLLLCLAAGQAHAQQAEAEKEIIAAMDDATVKWNKGDVDGYMALYDPSATMMYPTGRVPIDSIRSLYVRHYFAGGHPRQQLAYDTYQLTLLGKDYALLTGRFILKANDQYPERKGTFSLTMVHRKDGWKILHDHSG
jgi:ketosteroid isomerase-like protein